MKQKTKIFVLVCFCLVSTLSNAQDTNQLLKKIQSKFEKVGSFSTDFIAEYSIPGQSKRTSSGKFDYSPVDKYRLTLKGIVISSDGQVTRTYQKRTKKVIINYTSEYPNSLSLNKYLYDYPQKCDLKVIKKNELEGIRFIPKVDDLEFESAEIYVNKNFIISKIIITDYQGMVYTVSMKNLKADKSFTAGHFQYNGTEGVKIVDLR